MGDYVGKCEDEEFVGVDGDGGRDWGEGIDE